ncbi:MAG TPA: EAL domain-containing protein [Thermomonas sp.]
MPFDNRDPPRSPEVGLPAGRRLSAWGSALVAFLLGLALTGWLARAEMHRAEGEARREFQLETARVADAIGSQLAQCEHLIRAFQSIFLASESVTQDEYTRAYENMESNAVVRISLQALAYAERRRLPDGDRYITTIFAPRQGNEVIQGLDVTAQPMNLQALLRSRDTDQVAMSEPFRLRQTGRGKHAGDGFLLRLPVYAKGLMPQTQAARAEAIVGSLGASFRIADLIESTMPAAPVQLADLRVEDDTSGMSRPLYARAFAIRAEGEPYEVRLHFGGRTWRVVAHPRQNAAGSGSWRIVLWVGMLVSALLAALTWSLVSTRERAIALGTSMARRFQASEERFRRLNELLPCLVLLARRDDGAIVYRNAVARRRLSTRFESARLQDVVEASLIERLAVSGEEAPQSSDVQLEGIDGELFWASLWISVVEIDGIPMWLLVASDISEQRQLTERLSYQASHDSLTKLYNRREFEARTQALLAPGGNRNGALLFIDLDQFKLINDTSGHCAGDELLVQLAAVMRDKLRPGDVLGRLGGDEFGVLLRGVPSTEAATQAAERLRRSIEEFSFSWEQRTYTISASIGVVMLAHAASLKQLFAHADAACYLAKEAGRNRVHLYAEDDAAISSRLGEMEWANRIRDAIRDGRLLLDYQQLHPLQPGATAGAHIELLLRLRGEDGVEVLPGAFLPAAERYGLMPLIDRWVVENALGNLDRLHPDGRGLATCAINLSGGSLEDDELFDRIEALVGLYGIDPGRLVFEITETVAVRNFEASSALIARLRALGCRVALDDFGAGMSSFGYLKNLALDMLKIDGSFVQNMASDRMSQSIIRAVTEIGHQQGMAVIAEWVSSQEMLDMLAGMGVDYAQGFAFHRPERVVFQRQAHD